MPELRIVYQEVDLESVVRYYASGYEADVRHVEWFVDAAKGKVILRLHVRRDVAIDDAIDADSPGMDEG